jgi:hypothetical protein
MRRRLTYANVTATLALFFAMSGGALAAKHYLLTSTKQISPKVMKALKGNVGKAGNEGREGHEGKEGKPGKEGPEGHEGRQGSEGHEGKVGPAGPYPTVLPSGATETGDWGGGYTAGGVAEYRIVASFPIPLPATLQPSHVIYVASTAAEHCPGVSQAEHGYLCVYQKLIEHAETPKSSDIFSADEGGKLEGAGIHGFEITLKANAAALTTVSGTYAVTAP